MSKENPTDSEIESAVAALANVESALLKARSELDGYVAPVRQSLLKRYPTLFLLLTTLGVTAVFLGLEQILLDIPLFDEHPGVLFGLGVAILAVTGQLYKKLD